LKVEFKKQFFTIFLILGFCFYSVAQIITITNQETAQPIALVNLFSYNSSNIYASTNVKGQVDISAFKSSTNIEVSASNFKTITTSYAELEIANFRLKLIYSNVELSDIVVSATRWSQPSKNIPSKITIISARTVALLNPQTAADLLGASGEVFIQKSQQGGGSPMIRGFATNRLVYSVDGVRMNTAIFRAGNIQNVISLDPFAIENTEVFFGPGSIIYGSDAIGGVMGFKTLTPQFSLTHQPLVNGKAVARYSSANNEKTGHFDVNIGWKKWAILTSFTYADFGDLTMGTKGPNEYLRRFYVQRSDSIDRVVQNDNPLVQKPTAYSQINIMQKISFKPHKNWELNYGFHYSETSEYARYDRLIEQLPSGLPRSSIWNYGPQKWMMNQLTVTHKTNSVMYNQVAIRLAHQAFEESRIDRNFSGGQRFRLRNNLEQVQAYSLNIDFVKNVNAHGVYYGIEYIENKVTSVGTAYDIRNGNTIQVPDRYPNSFWESYAVYCNYQFVASKKFLVQAGARYNRFTIESDFKRHLQFFPFDFTRSEINNSALTASFGAVYTPAKTVKISANISSGFRAPNVDDIGKIFDVAIGEVVVPNTNLSAEHAYNCDVNIAKLFWDFVQVDVSGFYTFLDNAMVRRSFQVNGQDSILFDGNRSKVYAIQNASFASVYGTNIGLEIRLKHGLSVSCRYNYQLGIEEMENGMVSSLRHAAPAFGVMRLMYHKNNLMMQFYTMFSSEVSNENLNAEEKLKTFIYAKDYNGMPYSPAWYTINYKVLYQFTPQFSISSGVENITNQRYRPYSSGLVAPGANFIVSIRTSF